MRKNNIKIDRDDSRNKKTSDLTARNDPGLTFLLGNIHTFPGFPMVVETRLGIKNGRFPGITYSSFVIN